MNPHLTPDEEMKLHTLLSEMHTDAQPVNLHAGPATHRPARSACSDAPTEVDTVASPEHRAPKRERTLVDETLALPGGATSMPHDGEDPSVRREHHNKHTRKCRKKLKDKFNSVVAMLPEPAANQEVKHKVQILDYTMEHFHKLNAELQELEMTHALQSNANMLAWIDQFAGVGDDISAALMRFLDLFCAERGWVYAEIWRPANGLEEAGDPDAPRDMFVEKFVVRESPWCPKHAADKLRGIADRFTRNQEVVPSTEHALQMTVHSLQPQVFGGLSAFENGSQRAQLLAEAGVATSMLVPVIVDAEVVRIVAFHDTRDVRVGEEMKKLAMFVATSIGNAHNAAVVERAIGERQCAGAGRGGSRPARA